MPGKMPDVLIDRNIAIIHE